MYEQYAGVVIMHADPFEALVLTILSQNRTGEIVRKVYPALDMRCGGITPARLAAIEERDLAETIRSAGPYKAPRLAATAHRIAETPHEFARTIIDGPADQAMAYLTSLPGVAHKTAACVLVFAAGSNATLPADTHLFRVAHRLGLAPHDGRLNTTTRDAIIAALLAYGPDLAPAHFLFLGRSTCTAEAPSCSVCFAQATCPTAARPARNRP